MAEWPYLTNFFKWLWLTRSRDLHTLLKICLLNSLFFLNQIVDIRIIILSSTVHEIWPIDPIWPTLSTDLDYQGHVIFRQNRKCICSIPCSLKLYIRHRNNDYIVYRSRDMANCRGVFRGPLGYGPLWPKIIFLTLKKIWKTWLAPSFVWALEASESLAPSFRNPKYATGWLTIIWPTLSSDLDLQGHVIFRQSQKYVCWIPYSLKP